MNLKTRWLIFLEGIKIITLKYIIPFYLIYSSISVLGEGDQLKLILINGLWLIASLLVNSNFSMLLLLTKKEKDDIRQKIEENMKGNIRFK